MKPPGSNAKALPPLLTGGQLFAFIVQTIIGVGVLTLPREVATATRTDGYTPTFCCLCWGSVGEAGISSRFSPAQLARRPTPDDEPVDRGKWTKTSTPYTWRMPSKIRWAKEPDRNGLKRRFSCDIHPMKVVTVLPPVITTAQLAYLIAHTMIGVGVLTLPRNIAEETQGSGYVAIPLAALLNFVPTWLWLRLFRRFPNRSFFWMIDQTLPFQHRQVKTVYRVLWWLPLMGSYLLSSAIVARIFADVIAATVLPTTPVAIIVFMMLLTSVLFALMNVDAQMRINELLFPILVFPLVVIGVLALSRAEMYNLLHPLHELTPTHVFIGTLAASFVFSGHDVLAIYGSFLPHSRRNTLAAAAGIGISAVLYFLVTAVALAVFGSEELVRLTWPTFELVRVTTFPGLIFERLESAFLTVWVVAVFSTLANTIGAHLLLNQWLFSLKKKGKILMAFAILVSTMALALWPRDFLRVDRWSEAVGYYTFAVSAAYSLLLLLLLRRMPDHETASSDGPSSGTPNPADAKGGRPT